MRSTNKMMGKKVLILGVAAVQMDAVSQLKKWDVRHSHVQWLKMDLLRIYQII